MRVGLPAGIGDFSWAWSKLFNVMGDIERIEVCDGWPHRTVPYVELCFPPGMRATAAYGQFNYQSIQMFTKVNEIQNPTWEYLYKNFNEYACVLLEPNQHLELGRRLEYWLPDLPTEFHYPLFTAHASESAEQKLGREIEHTSFPRDNYLVGISCASYRGSEAWKTWGVDQWSEIFSWIIGRGWTPIILGGFWDDLSHTLACKFEVPDLVGKTSVAECVEILRILPAYIGFSSGLNVIRTVLDKPAFALWPEHQVELSTSWVPPQMLESQRYMASLWREPSDVWYSIKSFLDLCGEEHAQSDGKSVEEKRQAEGSKR